MHFVFCSTSANPQYYLSNKALYSTRVTTVLLSCPQGKITQHMMPTMPNILCPDVRTSFQHHEHMVTNLQRQQHGAVEYWIKLSENILEGRAQSIDRTLLRLKKLTDIHCLVINLIFIGWADSNVDNQQMPKAEAKPPPPHTTA